MKRRGKNKKGVSTIIVTIILVALVLIAIGIIWAVIGNMISQSSKDISIERLTVDAQIKGIEIDEASNNISVLVRRKPGLGNLIGFNFVFKNETDSELKIVYTNITELEEKIFTFHLDMNISQIIKINLIPIIKSGDKELFGSITVEYNVKGGTGISGGGTGTGSHIYQNLSDGFSIGIAGQNEPRGITFDTRNNSFWIAEPNDNFIYHYNSLGVNQSDGFKTSPAGSTSAYGITFDPRDNSFWITDNQDDFVYHFNSLGFNLSDGFYVGDIGSGLNYGITFDPRDNSFWVTDFLDIFVYHFDSLGVNQSNGFEIESSGINAPYGITFDPRDNSFWIVDPIDDFVYHFD